MRKVFKRVFNAFVTLGPTALLVANMPALGQSPDTIMSGNVVKLTQVKSPAGFLHPGISCNAETLSVMREKVVSGVSPWVDYFEGLRRTPFAKLDQRPRFVEQITNDGGIGGFAADAQLLWAHTILYVVTGDEAYRKRPVEIIKWYGGRTEKSFFPRPFADSHIKIGKYVYTFCSAVDILRTIEPKDKSLAVTGEMIDALQTNCIAPIRKNSIERNSYFMNQHSYAIMGFLASTILGDDAKGYQRAVEWTTVNATAENQGRNGSIKEQIRLVTRNDKAGQPVKPNLQLVEMGRDQPHAGGNVDNLLMMVKTIDFQKTKVDPAKGTVTTADGGVSPVHFLDDRLLKGQLLFVKYNLGYDLPWVPTYSETAPDNTARFDQISYFGRGSIGGNGVPAGYYYYKGIGYDLDRPEYAPLKVAFNATDVGREQAIRSGLYINQVHNYAFDFWIGLPATASDAKPDPMKAKRALAKELAPLEATRDERRIEGQFEYNFVDLSANAQPSDLYPGSRKDVPLSVEHDPDGTGYVRMTLGDVSRTMVSLLAIPENACLRVRSNKLVQITFNAGEGYGKRAPLQTLYVPDTGGEWTCVTVNVGYRGLLYVEAASKEGPAKLDFDCVDSKAGNVPPLAFAFTEHDRALTTYAGRKVEATYPVDRREAVYSVKDLPAGASLDAKTGRFVWTPSADQVGKQTFYLTARVGVSSVTTPVNIHVATDLQAALDLVAKVYRPSERYETATLTPFKAAVASKNLDALVEAADNLRLLTPKLADGSLDYCKTWSKTIANAANMADGDPLSWGGLWGFDKNVTMDFGPNFKVRSTAFALQARDGFPIRVAQAVVYGSNNGFDWVLLTENAAKSLPDLQTLVVKKAEQASAYRFLRFFMPARAYGIFEIAELRVYGERIEDYTPDYHKAYIKAFDDGTFRPDQPLTRAEAASSIANACGDYTDKGAYACDYQDVDRKAPYYDDLAYVTRKGLIGAVNGKRFAPQAAITRGELAGMMSRMNKLAGRVSYTLKDVEQAMPNAAEIHYVVAKGWLTADGAGRFRPNDPVTRAQFVTAVNQMLGRTDGGGKQKPAFKDVAPKYWAYQGIMEATLTHTVE